LLVGYDRKMKKTNVLTAKKQPVSWLLLECLVARYFKEMSQESQILRLKLKRAAEKGRHFYARKLVGVVYK